jgi:hypothetical protein
MGADFSEAEKVLAVSLQISICMRETSRRRAWIKSVWNQ